MKICRQQFWILQLILFLVHVCADFLALLYAEISRKAELRISPPDTKEEFDPASSDCYLQYVITMIGVNKTSPRESYYTAERRNMKWYKKFNTHFLQLFEQNAKILFNRQRERDNFRPCSGLEFRCQLIYELSN